MQLLTLATWRVSWCSGSGVSFRSSENGFVDVLRQISGVWRVAVRVSAETALLHAMAELVYRAQQFQTANGLDRIGGIQLGHCRRPVKWWGLSRRLRELIFELSRVLIHERELREHVNRFCCSSSSTARPDVGPGRRGAAAQRD